jgi:hypothetical protein
MSEPFPDEPSIATAGAARTAELARGDTGPIAERRRAGDRERKRRASAKAPPAETVAKPPVARAFGPIVTALHKIMSVQS